MKEVCFVDTTLRDGQQSLWAYGMRTGMMLPIAAQMDEAGFEAIEFGAPIELAKCVRELRENPWDRYRQLVAQIKKLRFASFTAHVAVSRFTRALCMSFTIVAWRQLA